MKKRQRVWWILAVLLVLIFGVATYHHQQVLTHQRRIYVQQHRLVGTYYAYVHDNGVIHKVRLRINHHHRAILSIVDSTQGNSTHVSKVNHLRLHSHNHTVTAPAYPGAVPDRYRHVGTTIHLTSGGQTRIYYRLGTLHQKLLDRHFIKKTQ